MNRKIITPPSLQQGDVLGIIAPAGGIIDLQRFQQGVAILSEMGFHPKFPRDLWPGDGYLADNDHNRYGELEQMLAMPEVKGIIAARGGYGCLRLLRKTDFLRIQSAGKMIMGFSDITILLNLIAERSGLICYHGPVVSSLCDLDRTALERLYHTLTGNRHHDIADAKIEILRGDDDATGKLTGGNLNSLLTLVGTPYDLSWDEALLIIEDINEPLYKIDRMLTQLFLTGKFDRLRGIMIGDFAMHEQDSLAKIRYTESIWRRVLELTEEMKIPVWGNFPVGHCSRNHTFPVGAMATMDHGKSLLRFD